MRRPNFIEVWLSLVVYRIAAVGGRRRQGDKVAAVDKRDTAVSSRRAPQG